MTVEEAVRLRSKELAESPSVLTYMNRGAALHCSGDYDQAIQDFTAALRLSPYDANCYFNRGESQLAKKAYKNAVADFTRAIQLYSSPAKLYEAYRLRTIAYEEKGDREAADADRRRATRLKWLLK